MLGDKMAKVSKSKLRYDEQRRQQAENSKKLILDAAEKLFLEKGLHDVVVKDIMNEAAVSRTCIYSHFDDFDHIVYQVAYRIYDKVILYGRDKNAQTSKESYKDILLRNVDNFFELKDCYAFLDIFDRYYAKKETKHDFNKEYLDHIISTIGSISSIEDFNKNTIVKKLIVYGAMVNSYLGKLACTGEKMAQQMGESVAEQIELLREIIKNEFTYE